MLIHLVMLLLTVACWLALADGIYRAALIAAGMAALLALVAHFLGV